MAARRKPKKPAELPPMVDQALSLGGRLVSISRYELPDTPGPKSGLTGEQLAAFFCGKPKPKGEK